MAKATETSIESRVYTINLSKAKAGSRNKRASRAMRILKEELKRQGEDNIKIDNSVNHAIWCRGGKKAPNKLEVQVIDRGQESWVSLPGEEVAAQVQAEKETEEVEEEETFDFDQATVDEVKQAVKDGKLAVKETLEKERDKKNRKSLVSWLEARAEETEEAVEEQIEEVVGEEQTEEAGSGLPESVTRTLKDGSIDEGKEALKQLPHSEFQKALNFEEEHQNRKGMKKFIESNMR